MSDAMYEVTQIALHLRDTGIMESLGESFGRGIATATSGAALDALEQAAKYLRGGAPVELALDAIENALRAAGRLP